MKKAISLLLIFMSLFSFFSCGEYNYASGAPQTGGSGEGEPESGGSDAPVLNDDPTDDFTVTVTVGGKPYSPTSEMKAYWNDGESVHTALVDPTGCARVDGLDGDYNVTLSGVPSGYTYDPNGNLSTNDKRNITIELYSLNALSGSGTGLYDCYKFSRTGVYSAVIAEPGDAIYFEFTPPSEGVYTVESWIDVSEDSVNPFVDVHNGTSSWKNPEPAAHIDDGGPVGSYTVNFVYSLQIVEEQISSGGQASFTFVIGAQSKYGQYPITVTFAVRINDEIEPTPIRPSTQKQMAIPTHDFSDYNVEDHEYGPEYDVHLPCYKVEGRANTYAFDQSMVKLWKRSEGGDDFYHIYDEDKYAENGGYGPILYAYITKRTQFIDKPFSMIEYDSNGDNQNAALSVGGYNYKHFIEGYTKLSTKHEINGSYYCSLDCTCHPGVDVGWACTDECENCLESCNRCPAELIGHEGYQAYANSDGAVAVTEELREFLYLYANGQARLFRDGQGLIDGKRWSGKYYQAPNGSEWLFACFYYE